MSFLYTIIIYPLQLIYKYIYLFYIEVTGSFGIGLLALSVCCSIAYVPLTRMARRAQKKERHLTDVMQPQIKKISEECSGAKRHECIARLYKRYSYHPIMAIRSAFGVFLQLPFLLAAYNMIGDLSVLQGQSFLMIKDLSQPDALLNGVNLLPILMTLVNFMTTFITPDMRPKDRIQAIIIAVLFLWLLYGAPSALLIFWTTNNIIFLIQNLMLKHNIKLIKSTGGFGYKCFSKNGFTDNYSKTSTDNIVTPANKTNWGLLRQLSPDKLYVLDTVGYFGTLFLSIMTGILLFRWATTESHLAVFLSMAMMVAIPMWLMLWRSVRHEFSYAEIAIKGLIAVTYTALLVLYSILIMLPAVNVFWGSLKASVFLILIFIGIFISLAFSFPYDLIKKNINEFRKSDWFTLSSFSSQKLKSLDIFGYFGTLIISSAIVFAMGLSAVNAYKTAFFVSMSFIVFLFAWIMFWKYLRKPLFKVEFFLKVSLAIFYFSFVIFYITAIAVPDINSLFGSSKAALLHLTLLLGLSGSLLIPLNFVNLENRYLNICNTTDINNKKLYFLSLMSFSLLFFVFSPSALYLSDHSVFSKPLWLILFELLPYFAGFILLGSMFYFVLPKKSRNIISWIVLLAVFVSLMNTFVFPGDYGNLDLTVLSNSNELHSDITIWLDILALALSTAILAFIVIKRRTQYLMSFLVVSCISTILFCGYACTISNENKREKIVISKDLLPEYNDRLWAHSKDGKNVIVFIFDMFTGGHMQEILASEPELADRLDGFTWFPDTTSLSHVTVASIPSIYGGPAFAPDMINERKEEQLIKKIMESYSIMANAAAEEGYDVAYAGIPYYNKELLQHFINRFEEGQFFPKEYSNDYVSLWKNWALRNNFMTDNNRTNLSKYFIVLSLFRLSPHSAREAIYDNGFWHGQGAIMTQQISSKTIGDIATLQFLPEISNTNSKNNTFKVVYNLLSHYAWRLSLDEIALVEDPYPDTRGQLVLVDGVIPEHLYTEQHMIRFLANYIDWLKQERVYDNTRIIVVSDHDQADSSMLSNSFLKNKEIGTAPFAMGRVYPGRSHALLLHKDFSEKGPIKISKQLMSTSDTPSLALAGIAKNDKVPGKNELFKLSSTDRTRKHFTLKEWELDKQESTKYIFSSGYQITGTIFNKDNWKKIK